MSKRIAKFEELKQKRKREIELNKEKIVEKVVVKKRGADGLYDDPIYQDI
jgi:hypothetical protein